MLWLSPNPGLLRARCLHGPARLRPRVVAASSRHLPVPINWEHELVFLIHFSLVLFVLNLIRRDDLIR